MTPDLVDRACAPWHLEVLGGFHPDKDDPHLARLGTLLMLGPREPGFWDHFTSQPEIGDAQPNPIDRWSARALTALAAGLGAHPFFPFGGPPHLPFFSWALRTGRCHASPVQLLVHDGAGLMVSFRGALGFSQRLDLPAPPSRPCDSCAEKPCLTSCPVAALRADGYDTDLCRSHLREAADGSCMSRGCDVRRSCPVSRDYGRVEAQSAFHMKAFLPDDAP